MGKCSEPARAGQAKPTTGRWGRRREPPRTPARACDRGPARFPGDDDALAELKELLRTAGVATAGELVQVRARPDPIGTWRGDKLAELKSEIARSDANLVACDDELVPRQERNLEAALGVPVIDRTAVILDIFADHAHSAEGKLQVELDSSKTTSAHARPVDPSRAAGRREREPGAGETPNGPTAASPDRIANLRRRLERLERNREVMRARRADSAVPIVALAGYTNAGKSTLLNALTGAGVGVGERLFHNLNRRRAPTATAAINTWSPTRSASSASSRTNSSKRSRRRSRRRCWPT